MSANDTQISGEHYKKKKIQPWDFIMANGIGYFEGNAIKYLCRWREKNGVEDLKKARHYIDKLIESQEVATMADVAESMFTTTEFYQAHGFPILHNMLGDEFKKLSPKEIVLFEWINDVFKSPELIAVEELEERAKMAEAMRHNKNFRYRWQRIRSGYNQASTTK